MRCNCLFRWTTTFGDKFGTRLATESGDVGTTLAVTTERRRTVLTPFSTSMMGIKTSPLRLASSSPLSFLSPQQPCSFCSDSHPRRKDSIRIKSAKISFSSHVYHSSKRHFSLSTTDFFSTSSSSYASDSSSSSSGPSSRYNHYVTLGVAEDATPQDIKKAFYSLSKRCHPDLHPDDERMAEKFKSLTVAYETLIDKEKRGAYDIEINIRKSTAQRWHGYSSAKYYPVAKGQRPQVSYAASDTSRRREKRRSEGGYNDAYFGSGTDDAKDQWIREQHRKMKQRLEEEDRQFKEEWKQMMGSRAMTAEERMGDDSQPLSAEEERKWQEFQNKLEERRKIREQQLAYQNERIALHPVLYYFYNMDTHWFMSIVWTIGVVGGLFYIYYVVSRKDPETMPYLSMKRQFEEEGILHKQKMAEKRERQKKVEALQQERDRQKLELMEAERKEEEEEEEEEDDDNNNSNNNSDDDDDRENEEQVNRKVDGTAAKVMEPMKSMTEKGDYKVGKSDIQQEDGESEEIGNKQKEVDQPKKPEVPTDRSIVPSTS